MAERKLEQLKDDAQSPTQVPVSDHDGLEPPTKEVGPDELVYNRVLQGSNLLLISVH
jgi:hypothetical protein